MRRSSSSSHEPRQRLCLTFGRWQEVKHITHLDLMRLWHRVLRRAGMPVSYSQGYNPRPRMSIAAPLALGVTSEGELLDVFLDRRVSLEFFGKVVGEQLPQGISLEGVKERWPKLPSLQSQVRFAEYQVVVESSRDRDEVRGALDGLLAKRSLPWEHLRDKEMRRYDLRRLIDDIWLLAQQDDVHTFGMRLRTDPDGAGRPDQVVSALGFAEPAASIHRTRLILAQP